MLGNKMFPRKTWCAQNISCDTLTIDGLSLQKEQVLVLLEKAKSAVDQPKNEQVCPAPAVSLGDVQLACQGECLSLRAELQSIREQLAAHDRRLEALESTPEPLEVVPEAIVQSLREEQIITEDQDEDVEDKPLVPVEKRGKRYYRTDTDEMVMKKNVTQAEDGTYFLSV